MSEAVTGILIFVFYIIETTISAKLSISAVLPDFVMALVICYATLSGKEKGALMGIAAGIFCDLLFPASFGKYIITYMLCGAGAGILSNGLFGKNFITASVITAVITFIYGVISTILLFILKINMSIWTYLIFNVLPLLLYNTLCSAFFYPAIEAAEDIHRRYI